MKNKIKLGNNPIIYQSKNQKILDEARDLFLKSLDKFIQSKKITKSEALLIKSFIEEAYLEKKTTYFLNDKIKEISTHLNHAINFALTGAFKEEAIKDNFTKVFYYRNKVGKYTYERFR